MRNGLDASGAGLTLHFGFLLMPEYTLSTFANAISVLRMANRISGKDLYKYSVFTSDGLHVKSSSGIEVIVDSPPANPDDLNMLVVCGGYNIGSHCDKNSINQFTLTWDHHDENISVEYQRKYMQSIEL